MRSSVSAVEHKRRESALKSRVMHALARIPGSWWFKVHGSPYQRAGIPDIIGVVRGQAIAIELKSGNNTPTRLQAHELARLKAAGARAGIARSVEEAIAIAECSTWNILEKP